MLEAMRGFLATDLPALRRTRPSNAPPTGSARRRPSAARPTALLAALRLDAEGCERWGEADLRDWYFTHVVRIPVPVDLAAWMREVGYTDPDEFHRDAFAAYLAQADQPGGPR